MYLIVVAGGTGSRMGADMPKQFLLLKGRPILMRTIERFREALPKLKVVLVMHPDYVDLWNRLCEEYKFDCPCKVVEGGKERFHSVKNGLDSITDAEPDAVVGVHDAVRPLVDTEVIREAYRLAKTQGAVVPVVAATDSVRMLRADGTSVALERKNICLVQTPQVFSLSLLREAYSQPYTPAFTDDASVVESLEKKVTLISGNKENIKITTPVDMEYAGLIIDKQTASNFI